MPESFHLARHMATNRPRYTVSVDDKMFKKIEDFRYENRFQTRSEATVELIRIGLETLHSEMQKKKEAEEHTNHPNGDPPSA